MIQRSRETFLVRAAGHLACFTRPEFKVERLSYEVMTPSAARGVLEAIHWRPAIRWVVTAIHVLAPIQFISFQRNEISQKASEPRGRRILKGEPFFVDEDRQQRNTVALVDVDYVIEAHIVRSAMWGAEDSMAKHVAMMTRRLRTGQTFHQPYLGCREFAAEVEPVSEITPSRLPPEWRNRELGPMLLDLEFGNRTVPHFFNARIDEFGKVEVPPLERAVRSAANEAEVTE